MKCTEDSLSVKPGYTMGDCHALSRPDQSEVEYVVHHVVPKTTSQKQGSELSNCTTILQITAATYLTHCED